MCLNLQAAYDLTPKEYDEVSSAVPPHGGVLFILFYSINNFDKASLHSALRSTISDRAT